MSLLIKSWVGFLAGLSVGVTCISLCLPVFLPVLLSRKRSLKESFSAVVKFSLGRLSGYLFFGFIFGYLGRLVASSLLTSLGIIGGIWSGILLILYSLGSFDQNFCAILPFQKIRWTFLLGFLTGVNVCPPFLASLAYVFNLKDVLASLLYFLMFFLGTSLYIIPAALLGFFSKTVWINRIARISGMAVGVFFVIFYLLKVW